MNDAKAQMNLASITPDLLGLILAFDCVNYASLPLWMCGCKTLRRKLAFGVTTVTLKNSLPYAICRVPLYLEELRHLRHLKLCRSVQNIIYPSEAAKTLRRLNPDLETLRLNFLKSHHFLDPQLAHDSDGPPHGTNDSQWTLKAAYPHLQTLSVPQKRAWQVSELENLPAQLTSLTTMCPRGIDDFKALMHALPHSLVKVVLHSAPMMNTNEFLATIPHQSWQAIKCANVSQNDDHILHLPPTLTTMDGISVPDCPSAAFVNALPPSLTAFDYVSTDWNDPVLLNFSHLTSLKSLGLDSTPGPLIDVTNIRTLPPTLQKAAIVADIDDLKVTDWPRDLVYLELTHSETHFPIEILPPGLTYLYLLGYGASVPMSDIALLPRTLTTLHLDVSVSSENVDFPPALKTLNLSLPDHVTHSYGWVDIEPFDVIVADGDSSMVPFDINLQSHFRHMPHRPKVTVCFPFNRLPKSITHLKIPCMVPGSQLKHLPPRLQHLYAIDIFEDSEFDGKSAESIGHMHEVFRIGREESESVDKSIFEVSYEWNLEASMSSLLPRSLVTWSLVGDIMALTMDWPRIPPCLSDLHLGGEYMLSRPISMDSVLLAPLSNLRELRLPIVSLSDAHMMALPRKLRMLAFVNTSPSPNQIRFDITTACVSYASMILYHYGSSFDASGLLRAFDTLRTKCETAYLESDLPTLRLLTDS